MDVILAYEHEFVNISPDYRAPCATTRIEPTPLRFHCNAHDLQVLEVAGLVECVFPRQEDLAMMLATIQKLKRIYLT